MLLFENLVPVSRTDAILKRLLALHPKLIDLSLERIERLLGRNRPSRRAPAAGDPCRRHQWQGLDHRLSPRLPRGRRQDGARLTSPHLVRFNERIRLAGKLVSSRRLNQALEACEAANGGAPITFFEITTAAAFKLFAEVKADYLLLETGMGGTYDASNVVKHPLGVIITPGRSTTTRPSSATPSPRSPSTRPASSSAAPGPSIGRQRDEGRAVLVRAAARLGITPLIMGEDFDGRAEDGRLVYQDEDGPARPAATGAARPASVRQRRARHRRRPPFRPAGERCRYRRRACAPSTGRRA